MGDANCGLAPTAEKTLDGVYGDPATVGPGPPRTWPGGVFGGSPMGSIPNRGRAVGSLAIISGGGRRRSSGVWLKVEVVEVMLEVDRFLL